MELANVKTAIYAKFLKFQRIHRLINSISFNEIYDLCDEEEKEKINIKIQELDKDGVAEFMKRKENSTYRELREIASRLGIKNYTYLSRSSLLSEIEKLTKTT